MLRKAKNSTDCDFIKFVSLLELITVIQEKESYFYPFTLTQSLVARRCEWPLRHFLFGLPGFQKDSFSILALTFRDILDVTFYLVLKLLHIQAFTAASHLSVLMSS